MNYLTKRVAAATVISAMAAPAMAATYSFDFEDRAMGRNVDYYGTYSTSIDDLSLDITAGRYSGPRRRADHIIDSDCSNGGCNWWQYRAVAKTATGIGAAGLFDETDIDGSFGNDLITLAFNQVVDFATVYFTGVDGNDDFDVFVDGYLVREDVNISQQNPFDLASLSVSSGRTISFGADGHYDNFRIGAIDVSYAAIPLPAGALLLLSGLFGLGFMRRRSA